MSLERLLYRVENALIMVVALYIFFIYGSTWTGFFLFLALPQVLVLLPSSWYQNSRRKKVLLAVDSLLHSYSLVVFVGLFCFLFLNLALWSIAGWVIHIAIDRVVKYREKDIQHPLFEARG